MNNDYRCSSWHLAFRLKAVQNLANKLILFVCLFLSLVNSLWSIVPECLSHLIVEDQSAVDLEPDLKASTASAILDNNHNAT